MSVIRVENSNCKLIGAIELVLSKVIRKIQKNLIIKIIMVNKES
ncbi:hypothetical protein ES703_64552 [subsurface metagenome]